MLLVVLMKSLVNVPLFPGSNLTALSVYNPLFLPPFFLLFSFFHYACKLSPFDYSKVGLHVYQYHSAPKSWGQSFGTCPVGGSDLRGRSWLRLCHGDRSPQALSLPGEQEKYIILPSFNLWYPEEGLPEGRSRMPGSGMNKWGQRQGKK